MKRNSMFAVATTVVIGLMADIAFAHGGTYTGPAGGGTPTYGGPVGGGSTPGGGGGSTPAGGGGGGGTTPGAGGGGGGSTPGGSNGGTRAPSAGGAPGGKAPGGRGGVTPGKSKDPSDKTHDWDFWWDLNSARFLNLKARLHSQQGVTTNKETDGLGNDGAAPVAGVTAELIANAIAPTVELALKDKFFDTRAAAAVALGKMTKSTQKERIDRLLPLLADERQEVREGACIGLGLTGSTANIPILMEILKNSPEGRKACARGTNDIETRLRAFAALSVGLIGSRESVDESVIKALIDAMNTGKADKDLQVGPVLALGIMRSTAAVPKLQELVKNADDNSDEIVRAHAAIALGKLGDRSSVKLLVEALADKKAQVNRSAAIALGLLTSKDDEATVAKLMDYAKSASDRAVKNFCLIALGEVGNVKGRDFLLNTMKTRHGHDQTFSAIALGVFGFKHGTPADRAELGAHVLEAWNETKSEGERSAYAIALGLLDYKPAAKPMMEVLSSGSSPTLKGYLCTGLGMMQYKEATPLIREEVKQTKDLDVQRRASIALGLMQDPEAIKILQEVIANASDNLTSLGGAAVALGFIGDRQAVETLKKISETGKDNARAFAAVALGILGDKDDLARLTLIQMNSNYLAATASLAEVLTYY